MRKVLSVVLVLTLVLSSFSMAFAADTTAAATATASSGLTDIASSANGQAIQVANNLGIVEGNPDGTFQPEKAVNRAEFAAMITRALGIPKSALAGYTSTSFKDTSGYGWAVPYLAFCQSKGIMLGDGAGNAMPGRTINTNEAATMVLRALGYTANSSALIGTWPSNYVSMAQDLGIYDDTASASNVDKQNAAQMIYNALTVQKVQVAADGTTTQLRDANGVAATMMTSGLNCTNEGYQIIVYDANAVINTVPYIGDYAKVYTNSDGDIVAIDDVKSTEVVATFNDEDNDGVLDVNETFTDDNDVDYTIKQITGVYTYYEVNKTGSTTSTVSATGKVDFVNGETKAIAFAKGTEYTLNVKLSNKNMAEVYSIEEWTPNAAAKIVAGDLNSIADGSLLGFDFATDKNDKIVDKSFELVGAASLSDIKADSVVYVYSDTTRDEITKVSVGTDVVEGTVTKVNATDNEWTVGGKVYGFGLNGNNGSSKYKDELNNDVKLYLDANGDIYKYDVTSGSAKDYASIITYDNGGTAKGNLKLYMNDDSKKTKSTDLDSWTNFENLIDVTASGSDDVDYGRRLIGYSLNKDGDIDGTYPDIDATGTITWGDNAKDGWYAAGAGKAIMPSNTVLKNMNQIAGKTGLSGVQELVVDENAVVFTYETSVADGAKAEITGVSKVANIEKDKSTALTGQVEALVRDGKVVAMIVFDTDCTGASTDSYAVVSAVDSAVNSAGDKAYTLTGYIDGKKLADDSTYTSSQFTITGLETVQVYKLKYNDDKNVSKMTAETAILGTAGGAGAKISANGYTSDGYIKTGTSVSAISANAVYYEVVFESAGTIGSGIKEFKPYNGTIYAGMDVWAFDTDTDVDGLDVIVIDKGTVKTYTDLELDITPSTVTVVSGAAATTYAAVATNGSGAHGFVSATGVPAGTTVTWANDVLTVDPSGATATPSAVTVTVTVNDATGHEASDTFLLTVN